MDNFASLAVSGMFMELFYNFLSDFIFKKLFFHESDVRQRNCGALDSRIVLFSALI